MERRDRSDSDIAQRKIFIGGLSYGTDDDKLRKYFSVYGTVQDAVVMKDPVSRRSRGFGFITFTDINSVDNTLANEPHTIDARKVEAKRAVPRSESRDVNMNMNSTSSPSVSGCKTAANRSSSTSSDNSSKSGATQPPGSPVVSVAGDPTKSPSHAQIMSESKNACDPRIAMDEYAYNKIFVGGLHYDTRDAEFKQYFEKFGKVISAEVMFNRETHKSRGFGFIVFEQENGAELVCQEREHVIDGKVVEVKRAIPRSRITPNGTILPPPVSSTGIAGRTGHNLSGQPLIRSMSGGPGGVNSGMNGIAKGGTGQLIRPTDAKRSMSMGGAPNSMGTMGGLNHSSPMKTGMNIGVQGQPRPKVTTGASYAAALKLGGGTDDNEGSLTDLLLGSVDLSLATGPPGNQLGLNMDGNNSLHTNGIAMRATGMAIERPSRSSSFSDQLGPSANPTNNPSFNGMSPASNPSPLISNNNATGTSNLSSNSHTMQSTSGQSLNSLGNLAQWLSTPPTKPIASMETVAGATGQQQQEMFPPLQLPSSSSGPSVGSVLGGVGPGQDSFLGFARPLVAPQGANMGMGQPGPYQHQQQQHQQQQQYMGGQPQQQPFMGIPGQGLNPHQPEYHQHQHQHQQQQQQQQHHQQGGYMPQQQQQYQQQQQQYQQQPQFHPQQQQQHQQQQGVMNQQYQQQYPPMPNSNHMQQQPLQQPPPSLGAWASMVANSSGHNNGEGGPMRNQPPPHPSQQQQQQQQYYDQQQQQAFHQAAGGHPQNFQHNQPPTDHTNNVGQGPNHYNHHQQQQGYPPLQPPSQQQQQQQSNSSGYPPSQGPGNNMYPSQPVAQPPSGPAQGQGPAGYPPSNNNNNNNVAINSDNTTTNQQQQSPQVNAPGFYNQSPPSTSLSPSMQPQQPGFSGLPAPGGIAFNAQLPSPHYSPLGYASVNGNVTNGGVGLGLVLEAQQMDLKHPSHGLIGSTTRGSRSESFGMRPDADSAGTILSGGGTGTGTTSRESRSESFSQSNASAGMSGGSTLSSHSSYAVNGSNNGGVVNGMNNGSSTESPRLSSLSLSTLPGAGNVGNGDSGSSLGGLAFEELKLDVAAPEFAPNGSTGPGQLSKGPPRLSAWGVPH